MAEMKSGSAHGGGGAPPRKHRPGRRRGDVWGAAMAGRRSAITANDGSQGGGGDHRIPSRIWRGNGGTPREEEGGCRRLHATPGRRRGGAIGWRHPQGGGGGCRLKPDPGRRRGSGCPNSYALPLTAAVAIEAISRRLMPRSARSRSERPLSSLTVWR